MTEAALADSPTTPPAGWLDVFRATGHVTVPGVFAAAEMDAAVADLVRWGEQALAAMDDGERAWYAERGDGMAGVLRKLDNPHVGHPTFAGLARDPRLLSLVESIIGAGVSVPFSQIFFKPPRGGGPKPAHQDNFYFGPSDAEGMVTAWIALDDATVENGCLHFVEQSHLRPLLPHAAPEGRPFDLQIDDDTLAPVALTPAPVPKGGVSFHHGGTIHRSADNNSDRWRRACAIHYVRNDVGFATPALDYDESVIVRVSG